MYIHYFNKTQLPESLFLYRRASMARVRKLVLAIRVLMVTAFCWRFVLSSWNGKYYSSYRLGDLFMPVTCLILHKLGIM